MAKKNSTVTRQSGAISHYCGINFPQQGFGWQALGYLDVSLCHSIIISRNFPFLKYDTVQEFDVSKFLNTVMCVCVFMHTFSESVCPDCEISVLDCKHFLFLLPVKVRERN